MTTCTFDRSGGYDIGIKEICIILVPQPFEERTLLYKTKNRQDNKGGTAKGSFLGPSFGFGWILSRLITS